LKLPIALHCITLHYIEAPSRDQSLPKSLRCVATLTTRLSSCAFKCDDLWPGTCPASVAIQPRICCDSASHLLRLSLASLAIEPRICCDSVWHLLRFSLASSPKSCCPPSLTHTHPYFCRHIHRMDTHMYTHTHTHTHTHTYKHTHTHTRTGTRI